MEDRDQSRLSSALTAIVGIWIAISPIWISVSTGLRNTAVISGIIIALAGLVQFFWENTTPSVVAALAAIWLFIAAFGYSSASTAAQWNYAISALITFMLAAWDGFEVSQSMQGHQGTGTRT